MRQPTACLTQSPLSPTSAEACGPRQNARLSSGAGLARSLAPRKDRDRTEPTAPAGSYVPADQAAGLQVMDSFFFVAAHSRRYRLISV
jgi:hypothetical protein